MENIKTAEILEKLKVNISLLNEINKSFCVVKEKANGLEKACEALVEERDNLKLVADQVESNLFYFLQNGAITKFLNVPGETLVNDPGFKPILKKLDECIEFMSAHVIFINSSLYKRI